MGSGLADFLQHAPAAVAFLAGGGGEINRTLMFFKSV